ncbi:hypothetical protein AQI88_19930 [Streptomyces cellostaticus]|uniref:Uncharacterized protein n=1 Tax=Streptomyces cellostaticus TaxID=67285 RepID=A0A117PWC5_9ACTN|nr:hypothetical protein [Streptomyces cellostaticus]KUM95077.1 hypothetical protein AQI88_19930 [Streptomyces cellostaticus]GHI06612.1 hypothetical protein Scel_49330 [Streptomyces cellostaticus]
MRRNRVEAPQPVEDSVEKTDVRWTRLYGQLAVAVPVAELPLPRVLGTLCLRVDLSERQTRVDVEPQ